MVCFLLYFDNRYALTLQKNARSREEEDRVCSQLIFQAIADVRFARCCFLKVALFCNKHGAAAGF